MLSALALSASIFVLPVAASTSTLIPTVSTTVKDLSVSSYSSVPILYQGKALPFKAKLIGGVSYVPLRAFFNALYPEASVTYNAKTKTATVNGPSLSLSASVGSSVLYANGRCFYSASPIVILSDGSLYLPIRSATASLSLSLVWQDSPRQITLKGTQKPVSDAASFYNSEDLYWLSRIISAESRGEPLIGQIAVGNVVLNRVRSKDYPSTVKAVVFDRKHGVQFSPIIDGSIYNTPSASAITAAKICLEGYTVSEKILFFYAPKVIPTCWISRNRPYAFTIANHKFYN